MCISCSGELKNKPVLPLEVTIESVCELLCVLMCEIASSTLSTISIVKARSPYSWFMLTGAGGQNFTSDCSFGPEYICTCGKKSAFGISPLIETYATKPIVLITIRKEDFDNIVGKRENVVTTIFFSTQYFRLPYEK